MSELVFTEIPLMGAAVGGENPMPDLKNVSYIHATFQTTERVTEEDRKYFGVGKIDTLLPYLSQDNYSRDRSLRNYRAAILENEFLRAVFLPDFGGRLWSLTHKPTGRELLYTNSIVQPCNLALRNAWIAGGVEWNVGIKGHTPFTCAPLFVAEGKNGKGEPILTMYEYERIRGTVFGINAYLEDEYLYIRTTVENLSDRPTYTYWWSNIAVPEAGIRVLTDAEEMFTCLYGDNRYTIDKIPAPCYGGEDLSYPERATRAGDLFYITDDNRRKWIAAPEKDGFGLLQYSTPELKGRKLFFWGKGQGGRNWKRFLSESDRPYVEIQAGLMRTQMEHIPMPAHSTWSWTECYTALSMDPEILGGDWKTACRHTADYVASLPDPAEADIPLDCKRTLKGFGSGWGALEGREISRYYDFPAQSVTALQAPWQKLMTEGVLPCPDPRTAPESYYVSPEMLSLLARSAEREEGNHWFTHLHLGINRYSVGDWEGAKEAWEKSLALAENPWALRNLSMLCKNDLRDPAGAVAYMERAVALSQTPCRGLAVDCAKIFTDCGRADLWLAVFETLPEDLKADGRLRLYTAVALMQIGRTDDAKGIVNESFFMSDIKEGELSVTAIWAQLYGDLSRLPARLDFRMHE